MSNKTIRQLPIFATLVEAFSFPIRNWKAMTQSLSVPTLLLVIIQNFLIPHDTTGTIPDTYDYSAEYQLPSGQWSVESHQTGSVDANLLPVIAAYATLCLLFVINCHREIILTDKSASRFGALTWPIRVFRFFFWGLLIIVVSALPVLSTFVMSFPSVIIVGLGPGFGGLIIFAAISCIYVFSRLSIILPAVAVDNEVSLSWAWNATQGNGGRLVLLITILPAFLFPEFSSFNEGRHEPHSADDVSLAAITVLEMLCSVFEISILSTVYKFLSKESSHDNNMPLSR